ncbi:ChaN family lipoprotein [candidate division KSB1 bacterium]|nr:ChaN family lipoprotein [candidate division KSB1 bacterium]
MKVQQCKRQLMLPVICLLFCWGLVTSAAEDEFNVERLPIGNPATKYDFCAVKLNHIFDTAQNKSIESPAFFQQLARKRIVMVGESHTNPEHHRIQLEIVQGLVQTGKPVCLVLEMFTAVQNPALAEYMAGQFPNAEFMDRTGWLDSWGYNYRMYQPIFEFARAQHLPLFGVNLERKYVSQVGLKGWQALSPDEKNSLPVIDSTNIEHRFLIKAYFTGGDAEQPAQFQKKYLAQCLWDATMAEGTLKAARENPQAVVVLLAGSGHIAYNLGIGKIIQQRSDFPFASVLVVDVPRKKAESMMETMRQQRQKKEAAPGKMPTGMPGMMNAPPDTTPRKIVIRSLADFLWGVADTEGKDAFPALGVRFGEKTEPGFLINNVFPKSIAQKQGLQEQDVMVKIDGKSFDSLNAVKKYLFLKNWDDPIEISILRAGVPQDLKFILKWEKPEADD